MKVIQYVMAVTMLLVTCTATVFAADTCSTSVSQLPASCTGGTITQDIKGGCRTIICANGADNLQIMACDKPGSSNAQYFEMYKQSKTGTAVSDICLGNTCIGSNGFVKSTNYPMCSGSTQPTTATTTTTTTAPTTTSSTCSASAKDAAVTCTSAITQDTWNGCRQVVCGTNANNIKVLACDKTGYFEVYKQAQTGTAPKVCFGSTCIQNDGYAKSNVCSATSTTTTTTTTVPTTTTSSMSTTVNYNGMQLTGNKMHYGITATQFWVGQGPSADTGWTNNYDSAWDTWWTEHYGGFDDPNNRNGYYPAAFTPKENPFYVAVPYTDFGDAGRKADAFQVVPWAKEKSTWGYQESMIKNRWVKITKNGKAVYAQVENSGPGPTNDWQYVFGTNPQPTTSFGWKAGIDVSPAVRDYLTLNAVDVVDWQFVDASQVPSGPWKNIVTTRQSCWASRIEDCR
jgi:hypothetical protein